MKKLIREESDIIINKGTEPPFSGKYNNHFEGGLYICKQCGVALYKSGDKFSSSCGWPAFDDAVKDAVKETPDADGQRTEITCSSCGAHLGHIFKGEGLTSKNTRHCVNSLSMDFIGQEDLQSAVYAGGCFWGVQYLMQKAKGVLLTEVGYSGGHTKNPTYKEVCNGDTGHFEVIKVVFNKKLTEYRTITKLFFEIHNPEQTNGQGPDIGQQYLSKIFYADAAQKQTAQELIDILKEKGLNVATELLPAAEFWPAEDYHQNYYNHKGTAPYCHAYTKRF